MRINRSIPFLTLLATVAACGSPAQSATAQPDPAPAAVAAAPEPAPVAEAAPGVAINVRWNSAPLDAAYHRERVDLDALHTRERAHPNAGESADSRSQRQATESKALEVRYARGKSDHARSMPPR
jgi:hypothetical protein